MKEDDDHRPMISNLTPGGAAEAGGLQKDDVIVAIDGRAVTSVDDVIATVKSHKPGDPVKIAAFRLGELREFQVTLRTNPTPTYTLKLMEHPTELQSEIYKSWLGIK